MTSSETFHQPVLLNKAIALLNVQPGSAYIDATVGNGGHTIEILKQGGVVYGIDQDPHNLDITQQRLSQLGLLTGFHPIHNNFSKLDQIVSDIPSRISGVIFDLGLSINQQKSQNRGFSFSDQTSLDMRLDPTQPGLTAEEIINTYSFEQLYPIFTKYAQEKLSRPLIYQIINARQKKPLTTATQLSDVIHQYFDKHHFKTKNDPATKIFMALRIVVNQEFDNLKTALDHTLSLFTTNTLVSVITFHSGEDRIVKQFIRNHQSEVQNLTPKGIRPDATEILQNPLSRSATLRSYKII